MKPWAERPFEGPLDPGLRRGDRVVAGRAVTVLRGLVVFHRTQLCDGSDSVIPAEAGIQGRFGGNTGRRYETVAWTR